jgi:hypothetical protein
LAEKCLLASFLAWTSPHPGKLFGAMDTYRRKMG